MIVVTDYMLKAPTISIRKSFLSVFIHFIACNQSSLFFVFDRVSSSNQRTVQMDFENASFVPRVFEMDRKDSNEKVVDNGIESETDRNSMVLQLLRIYFEMIRNLCIEYQLYSDAHDGGKGSRLVPHCTIMKVSKLNKGEMKNFIEYNKRNKIRVQKEYNQLGDNEKRMNRNKVLNLNILSAVLNAEHLDEVKQKVTNGDTANLYQDIAQIDLCAMQSDKTDDGFYKILHSFSIAPMSESQ